MKSKKIKSVILPNGKYYFNHSIPFSWCETENNKLTRRLMPWQKLLFWEAASKKLAKVELCLLSLIFVNLYYSDWNSFVALHNSELMVQTDMTRV